jgi:hypothetical protein
MKSTPGIASLVAAVLAALAAPPAAGQGKPGTDYPNRPVRLIVPKSANLKLPPRFTVASLMVIVPESLVASGIWIGDPPQSKPKRLFAYPPQPTLSLRQTSVTDGFELTLKAYPGVYSVEASENLDAWVSRGLLTNVVGEASAVIALPESSASHFYRVLVQ